MKKLILAALILSGCQINGTSDNQTALENITYFKDPQTGICFASINSMSYSLYPITSIACVPCDSLTKILKP